MKTTPNYYSFTTYKDIEDLKRLDFIVNAIKKINKPNISIIDIGCGNGNISLALGSLGFNVTGVDIDKASIDKANSINTLPNVQFKIADASTFTIDNNYDAVVCSEVLEHLDKPWELAEQIFKILKPNGVFVATVPNGQGPREILITRPMQWLHRKNWDKPIISFKKFLGYDSATLQSSNEDLTHIQYYTVNSFTAVLTKVGFKNTQWNNADFVERIFPYSILTKRIPILQKIDCALANHIPKQLTCGFYTAWTK